jgi:hypothetical protein
VYAANDFSAFIEADYTTSAPAATAAAALASLHNYRAEFDWDSDPVGTLTTAAQYESYIDIAAQIRTQFQNQIQRAIGPVPDLHPLLH